MAEVKQRVRVLLVDDENLVRAGLRMILEGDPGIEIVGECSDGIESIAAVNRLDPDLVLMDIRMPRMDGISASQRLLEQHPDLKILVLTTFEVDEMVFTALKMGVSGFLLKDTVPAELVSAIHAVAGGRTTLSESVTRTLIDAAGSTPPNARRIGALEKLGQLTEREREIATAIARGLSNSEIAEQLFISLSTVKTHIGRVLEKLDAENRVQVAIWVYESEAP